MADEVKVWQVSANDNLKEVSKRKLNLEARLEEWIKRDTSVLVPNGTKLLRIGQQIITDLGKRIDLLYMDARGNLVIVELKRDRTPREVTAQAIEYASWVQALTADRIEDIALSVSSKPLRDMFEEAFDDEYPTAINAEHSILVVAAEIDDSTERIIRYLSAKGIDINFVRFHVFVDQDEKELLIRTFTVPPAEAEQNISRSGNTKNTRARKTLEIRLKETSNPALRSFLERRLNDPNQISDKAHIALIFKMDGKARFRVRARKSYMYVAQIGRFPDDVSYWKKNLSEQAIAPLRRGTRLRFRLATKEDFEHFEKALQNGVKSFQWASFAMSDESDAQDSEDELDEE